MNRLEFLRFKIKNRRQNRGLRLATTAVLVTCAVALCLTTDRFSAAQTTTAAAAGNRRLMGEGFSLLSALDGKECSRNISPWPIALILWILGVLYMFLAIAIVCDDFFVASLERITEALQLSDDVAGATFMAAGSSAPELFTSVAGVFFVEDVKNENPGAGTIVGSAVFNIAIIIGASVICAGTTLELDWWPLARDGVYYSFAVICVILVFIGITPGQVDWWEGMMFLIFYALYIVVMKFNQQLAERVTGKPYMRDEDDVVEMSDVNDQLIANRSKTPMVSNTPIGEQPDQPAHPDHAEPHDHEHPEHAHRKRGLSVGKTYEDRPHVIHHHHEHPHEHAPEHAHDHPPTDTAVAVAEPAAEPAKDDDDDDDGPQGPLGRFISIISKPIVFVFEHTIPDCKEEKYKKWFPVSFTVSVLWIAVISYLMVEFALKMGLCLGLSANTMGLTVLAAGTSVPDALSSINVAKKGKGNMAISNAIGSNIFDIFLGLGLPWFLYGAAIKREPLPLSTHGIVYDIIMLFLVLLVFIAVVKLSHWRLKVWQGWVLCSLYGMYTVMAVLIDKGTIPTIYHAN